MFQKNEIEVEIKHLNQRLQSLTSHISKIEPVFRNLERIDQICKEQNIQGYLGRLVDFIECDQEALVPCVDIAASKKLMAIVVDNVETAKIILEINKKLKGGIINIYPLEDIEDLKKPLKEVPQNVKSML